MARSQQSPWGARLQFELSRAIVGALLRSNFPNLYAPESHEPANAAARAFVLSGYSFWAASRHVAAVFGFASVEAFEQHLAHGLGDRLLGRQEIPDLEAQPLWQILKVIPVFPLKDAARHVVRASGAHATQILMHGVQSHGRAGLAAAIGYNRMGHQVQVGGALFQQVDALQSAWERHGVPFGEGQQPRPFPADLAKHGLAHHLLRYPDLVVACFPANTLRPWLTRTVPAQADLSFLVELVRQRIAAQQPLIVPPPFVAHHCRGGL